MTLNMSHARQLLRSFELETLFVEELGWDRPGANLEIAFDGQTLGLQAIAEKRGMGVYLCPPLDGAMPDHATRRRIEATVRKSVHEHLLAFTDADRTRLKWLYVRREPGRPMVSRELDWYHGQSGEALLQQLDRIGFALDEEESIGIVDVTSRVRAAFDVDKVTKKFYDRFKVERDALRKMVQGIPDADMADWYVAVTLNRLMFIYFIQRKGFLNGDSAYLATRLAEWRMHGQDRYYREFLCPLFFRGFALPREQRTPQDRALLGDVPYLNGGIFSQHELEQRYGQEIQIPDAAFERVFAFFDAYRWHLDERPLRADDEINPDVLGYIFEKYVNQKQMGAYYTKEDITGYISRNTVLPHLLDRAKESCQVAFAPDGPVWRLLSEDPDRYIWPAVRHGCDLTLPEEIQAGVNPPTLHNIVGEGPVATLEVRKAWNRPAPEEYGLPTEIWRETVARRQRYEELWLKLVSGEIHEVNDLITWNLDIAQFCQDVVENCEGADLLTAFWRALTTVTVLDPTCGSGAFLFAALNLLEPLYEACLDRMAAFLDEWQRAGARHPNYAREFTAVLDAVGQHPNRRYYVLKSIIVRNLYGVDIMDEAVEICRLRLFLKLVAQVEDAAQVEPLPDIDFNIRAGNTLVGFTSLKEVEEALTLEQKGAGNQTVMLGMRPEEDRALAEVKEQAEIAGRAYALFQDSQVVDGKVTAGAKAELQARLDALDARLDAALAHTYGVNPAHQDAYARWCASHKPFHWLTAYYGIMQRGGFDVIIGNPPYVEYSKVRQQYTIRGYGTEACGNLYGYIIERCFDVLAQRQRMGMIVQLPMVCTDRMIPLQDECFHNGERLWFATFDDRPARLFDGLEHIRATVFLAQRGRPSVSAVFATKYNRWYSQARTALFECLQHAQVSDLLVPGAIPKVGDRHSARLFRHLTDRTVIGDSLSAQHLGRVYFHNSPQYWIRAMDYVPYFWNERDGQQPSTQVKALALSDGFVKAVVGTLSSSLFYWWFIVLSDCRHLNLREIERFPVGLDEMSVDARLELGALAARLVDDLQANARRKTAYYKTTGRVEYDEYYPSLSKAIIDEIDTVLARHYGFTEEELDFIINYDIKYRMGDALNAADDGEEE